ncbi:MAG: nitrous oxide reductase accessory protein NosL [bacterium]|uniref:Nitrous oxide reductase accessory protein NosL n=1 Tax=Candidatus Methylomirabilis tolerans TaxID=3123416 RepID=A0AAJ1AJF2_9BACT|nr:nitrous oxide reductase accessory protein NosL [Candidatus Methylomirabilis sp.]
MRICTQTDSPTLISEEPKKEASAKEFLEDHKGIRILRFADVTAEVIDAPDVARVIEGEEAMKEDKKGKNL